MLNNKRNRICEDQENSNPPRKKQKMEETSLQARKKSEAITQKIPSFETIGTDVVVYTLSTFLDLSAIHRAKGISTYLNATINNNMNTIVKEILRLKNEPNLKENVKRLRKVRYVISRCMTTDPYIVQSFGTYSNQIAMQRNNCSLLIKFNEQKCIPPSAFIEQIVKSTIKDHCKDLLMSYKIIKVRVIEIAPFTITIKISNPIPEIIGSPPHPININILKKTLEKRLVLNMHNYIATIDNKRTVLFGDRKQNEIGILYNYPNSNIFGGKYQSLLYKVNHYCELSVLNTYFMICNFIRHVDFKIVNVHHKKTRFTARNFPNKYESELFKLVGPNVCKRNIILRTKRQSILWMNRRFHLDEWKDEFPWGHMHMCGSSVLGALDPSLDESVYPIGDLDFFNIGRLNNKRWSRLVVVFMAYITSCNHTVYVDTHSQTNNNILTRVKYSIQWDGTDDCVYFDFVYVPNHPTHPINAFDISISQAAFDGNNFYCSQSFKQSIITNTFTSCIFGGIKEDLELQMERPYKYVSRGYNLLVSKEMKDAEVCKIESILERTNHEKYFHVLTHSLQRYVRLHKQTLDIYNVHDKFINLI